MSVVICWYCDKHIDTDFEEVIGGDEPDDMGPMCFECYDNRDDKDLDREDK